MNKKPATVDDNREPILHGVSEAETIKQFLAATEPPEIATLVNAGIIIHRDGMVTWRVGHLEHVANLYKGDPVTTARDYADDLAVAREYSADEWERLTK